ncbi:MAG: hypothetical protein HQM08_07460 [Candidatus Riflebacteria bacterium]|nr:hypothetical protein [Candidatus Riflebacteria bacterium]
MKRIACNTRVFLLISLIMLICLPIRLSAGNSIIDTIHDAEEQGQAKAFQTPSPSVAKPFTNNQIFNSLSASDLQNIINQIINAIHSASSGISSGKVTIVIPQPPAKPPTYTVPVVVKPPVTPVVPPTTTVKPPVVTTPPVTAPPVDNIAGLKAKISSKYGINALDGDGSKWTEAQLTIADKVFASLPNAFVKCTKTVQRDAVFMSPNVLGYVKMGIPTVHLLNSSVSYDFQGTLVHEMTHCFQASNSQIATAWQNKFWPSGQMAGPKPPSVSSYGNTQPLEDMAESVRVYWNSGATMKAQQPDRYNFIKNNVMSGREF